MNRLPRFRSRRAVTGAAMTLMVVLPVLAWFAAPDAGADSTPGSNLGGLNANSSSTAAQFIPLIKGLLPAGNLATGDFFQISVPYSGTSSETGPASTAIATPAYPGPVATSLPGALQTEGFPAGLAKLLTDPVLAQAAYPPTPTAKSSGSYSPPAGSTTGAGTSNAQAAIGGSAARANLTNTPLANGTITVGSSVTSSSTTIEAGSVSAKADAQLGHIVILGLVDIASISSESTASSDGNKGVETSSLKVGAVTVAGQPAYIDQDGLHLAKTSNDLGGAVTIFNSALVALQQAGISVSTIAPQTTVEGAMSSVDSGAVQIQFIDGNIPNPQGDVPFNSVGTDIDLGLTHADAQATALPPIPTFTPPPVPPTVPVSTPASLPPFTGVSGSGSQTIIQTNSSDTVGGNGSQPVTAPLPPGQSAQQLPAQPASFIGMPTRLAWVVIAIILSIVASGPLLGYANWQLLRGRKS